MTRGSDETPATTLPQGQSIFGSGGAPSRNTQSIELEYSKDSAMLSLSYEDVPAGAGADARAHARGPHKLYMNGATRHSFKEFIADIPQDQDTHSPTKDRD